MIDAILARYKKLKAREKTLTLLFIAVIVIVFYHRLFYKPVTADIATYKFQVQKLRTRLDEITAELPPIDRQEDDIRRAALESEKILSDIAEIEKRLPSRKDASYLIAEVARLAEGVELISVQQKVEEGDVYSRIFIELTSGASYNEVVDYIDRLETISPFLKIEEMRISEPKGRVKGPGVSAHLLLSCLLSETPISEWSPGGEIESEEAQALLRDIFVSKSRPVTAKRKTDLKLEGIIYEPNTPTAIINDTVVRVGSEIAGFKVKEILPGTVIVADDLEEHSLSLDDN